MNQPETPETEAEQPLAATLELIGSDTDAGRCVDDVCEVPNSPSSS